MKNTMIEAIYKIYSQETNTRDNKEIDNAANKIIRQTMGNGGDRETMAELVSDFEYEVKKASFVDGFKAGMELVLETLKTASR